MEPLREKKKTLEIEPISPIKRKMGKLKEPTVNEQAEYNKQNIEDLLLGMGVEFRNPEKVAGGWLPLEAYDDKEFDTRLPVAWVNPTGNALGGPREGVGA